MWLVKKDMNHRVSPCKTQMLGEHFGAPYGSAYRIVLVLFLQNFRTYPDKIQILGCDS